MHVLTAACQQAPLLSHSHPTPSPLTCPPPPPHLLPSPQLLGKALSTLPRDQVVIATKVGKYAPGDPVDFSADRVTRSVMESLERLQTPYLDIVYCHDIEFMEDMSQVRRAGGGVHERVREWKGGEGRGGGHAAGVRHGACMAVPADCTRHSAETHFKQTLCVCQLAPATCPGHLRS